MGRKIKSQIKDTKFKRDMEININGFIVESGDLIKIKGEYGSRFKFQSLTTNTDSNAQWVDCFEVFRGQVGAFRSFSIDRVKRIPGKRKKK